MSLWKHALPLFSALSFCLIAQVASAEMVLNRGNGAEPQSLDPQISEGVPASHIQRDLKTRMPKWYLALQKAGRLPKMA